MLILNRAALWPLTLLAGVLMASPAAAKDRPIIIDDGSPLKIQHDEGWKVVDQRTLVTRYPDNTVTSVEVTPEHGDRQVFGFSQQQCEIDLTFGEIRLAVQTDSNGQNLRVMTLGDTRFSVHLLKKSKRRFQSTSSGPRTIELKILKAGVAESVAPHSGHTRIVIHYEDTVERGSAPPSTL
jgi:hypothetical protein